MIHGFFSMPGLIPMASEAIRAAAHAVRDALKYANGEWRMERIFFLIPTHYSLLAIRDHRRTH